MTPPRRARRHCHVKPSYDAWHPRFPDPYRPCLCLTWQRELREIRATRTRQLCVYSRLVWNNFWSLGLGTVQTPANQAHMLHPLGFREPCPLMCLIVDANAKGAYKCMLTKSGVTVPVHICRHPKFAGFLIRSTPCELTCVQQCHTNINTLKYSLTARCLYLTCTMKCQADDQKASKGVMHITVTFSVV